MSCFTFKRLVLKPEFPNESGFSYSPFFHLAFCKFCIQKTLLNISDDTDGESVWQELKNLNDQLDSNPTAISENAVTLLDGLIRDKYTVAKPATEMETETGLTEEGAEQQGFRGFRRSRLRHRELRKRIRLTARKTVTLLLKRSSPSTGTRSSWYFQRAKRVPVT